MNLHTNLDLTTKLLNMRLFIGIMTTSKENQAKAAEYDEMVGLLRRLHYL